MQKTAVFILITLFLALGAAMIPSTAEAQSLLQPRSSDRDRDDDASDDDIPDYESDGETENLPIPVLFGTSIDTSYSTFGDPRGGGTREHEGFDIMAPTGVPIVSPTDARVRRVGSYSGAGKYVITETDDDLRFYYYHLENQARGLDRGDDLDAGDLIGFVGYSGNAIASAPHLHLEIHEGRNVVDPYPYFTRDFSLEEKMQILEGVLDDVRDEDELAEFLAEEFASDFAAAAREGVEIPEEIQEALPGNFQRQSAVPNRDLDLESSGTDVRQLQQILISGGYLDISTPTGYFGPLTQTALVDYQRDKGISPAVGYYGPITRRHMARASDLTVTNQLTRSELIEQIEVLQQQVAALRTQL